MNLELLIAVLFGTMALANTFDFIVYVLKPAPKARYFTKKVSIIGFVSLIIVGYYILNGYHFL